MLLLPTGQPSREEQRSLQKLFITVPLRWEGWEERRERRALTARTGETGHDPAAPLLPARWRASAPASRREARYLILAGRVLEVGSSAGICC